MVYCHFANGLIRRGVGQPDATAHCVAPIRKLPGHASHACAMHQPHVSQLPNAEMTEASAMTAIDMAIYNGNVAWGEIDFAARFLYTVCDGNVPILNTHILV